MKKYIVMIAVVFASLTSIQLNAQSAVKIGHINSLELIDMMPSKKTADQQLEAYAKELEGRYTNMMKEYQRLAEELQAQQASMDDLIFQRKVQDLRSREESIGKFQMGVQEKVAKKKNELYTPILEQANQAVQDVSAEQGFTYVFDSAALVFAGPDGIDILPLVKAKLGIQ